MAINKVEPQKLLRTYVDCGDKEEKLREVLLTLPVNHRHKLLITTLDRSQASAIHQAVRCDDIESLRCMLSGFSSTQHFELVRLTSSSGYTAIHLVAMGGYTEITKFLLNNLTPEQRFIILAGQDKSGRTPVHHAAEKKQMVELQILITSVAAAQRNELLIIRDNNKRAVSDIIQLTDLPYGVAAWATIEITETSKKVAQLETLCREQQKNAYKQPKGFSDACQRLPTMQQEVNELKKDLKEANQKIRVMEILAEKQSKELKDTKNKLATVEKEQGFIVDQLKGDLDKQRESNALQEAQSKRELYNLTYRQDKLENTIGRMNVLMSQPFCVGPEMDQAYEAELQNTAI